MKIDLKKITVRELVSDYRDDGEGVVVGYGGKLEIIDGQQRTISVAQYVHGDFSLDGKYFHSLQADEQGRILDYELTIYACTGTDSEKLAWFKVINIAGETLRPQELRNAVYAGPWLADARAHFSRPNGPAQGLGSPYLSGSPILDDFLEDYPTVSREQAVGLLERMTAQLVGDAR